MSAWLSLLRARLAEVGDPERAAGQQRYMKSAMPYHGVANPGVRKICAEVFADYPFDDPARWREDVRQIWHGATHREERYGALALCGHRDARPLHGLPKTARARTPLDAVERCAHALDLYEELVVSGAWWDLVDEIATHRLSALLVHHRFVAGPMRAWSRSPDLWLRRAAILCQIPLRAETDSGLLLETIENNVEDRSFWLRKAIGWALRQYARTDPEWVKTTVATLGSRLSPLSRREATKKTPRGRPKTSDIPPGERLGSSAVRCREPIQVVLLSAVAACASAVPPDYAAQLARLEEPALAIDTARPEPSPADPSLDPSAPLELMAVTREVLTKNPRLDAMRHTWRAMLAMAPQVSAMPDPTLEVGLAPLAIHTGRGQRLSFRQALPWPGSRGARARATLTEASAMEYDLLAMKRELVAMAHMAYWELAAAPPLRALWHKHHALIETLREATLGRIQSNKARPQDAVRAESELVMAEQMLLEVDRMERVATARLNTVMRRPPDSPLGVATLPDALPPTPPQLAELTPTRAELDAALIRVKAREGQVHAVEKMNRPMLGWGVELSTMGDDWMMWPMLMFMVELPLASERRDAMLDEAKANVRVAQSTAEALRSELRGEVAERRAELVEALARHENFARLLVPTLERRLSLTVASYGAGQDDFDAVMMAATALNDARVGELEAKVQAFIAATGLELALGRLVEGKGEVEPK